MTIRSVFTAKNARRLTGLSDRQLRYWDATGYFLPSYVDENQREPDGRIYSFRDVVGLRAIALLRDQHGIPLSGLREVGEWLTQHAETPWAELRLYVTEKQVYFDEPPKEHMEPVIRYELEEIARDIEAAARRLRERQPEHVGRIVQDRYVLHNAPVLAGTRVPTSAIWDFHRAGYDTKAILAEYPRLTEEDIRVALAYEEQRHASLVVS